MATVAFISGGKFYRVGEDGVARDAQGVAYGDGGPTIGGVQTIVKRYEHRAYSLPRWKQEDHPGEACPYPNVDSKGIGCFSSKREVNQFQASHPAYRWDIE